MKALQSLRIALLLCAVMLPAAARALTYWDNYGIWYYVSNNDGTAIITGFRGSGDVTVPNNIYGMPVTILGGMTYGRPNLHSVIIPNSITSIGNSAFYESGLISVTIPDSVTNIGYQAFYESSLTSVTIPDSVTSIGQEAFYACDLTNATIGNGLASIQDGMFDDCRGLTSFAIPGSVRSIGSYAFNACFNLTNIIISNGVTTIGDYAFSSCTYMTNVTIPASVTNIGAWAFAYRDGPASMYFEGNAPASGGAAVFSGANVTVYYLPGTTGWGATFGDVPTVLWNPQAQTSDGSFGVRTNQFGFTITGSSNLVIVVEACTLTNSTWIPVGTNTLNTFIGTNGTSYFGDPQWTNYPLRCYRLRSP
jgi:hypothetical protein